MKKLFVLSLMLFGVLFSFGQTASWVSSLGTTNDEKINDIAADASGNVYVAGQMGVGSITIGSDVLNNSASGSANGFLAKYNSSGVAQWGVLFDNYLGGQVTAVEVDGSGNVFIAGEFTDSLQMNPKGSSQYIRTQTKYTGAKNFYVAKYNASGILQWADFMQSTGEWDVRSLVLDASGNVYVTGSGYADLINSNATDSAKDVTQGTEMPFLAKFTSTGTFDKVIIIRTAADNLGAKAYDIAMGKDGRLVICGSTEDTISFGSSEKIPNLTNSKPDVFVAKYSTSLTAVWGTLIGGTDDDEAFSITTNSSSKIWVTGSMQGSFTVGSDNLTSKGSKDILVAQLDSNGTVFGGFNIGGAGNDLGQSIAIDNNNFVWISGVFTGSSVDFNPGTGTKNLNGGSAEESFLAQYNTTRGFEKAMAIGDAASKNDYGLALYFEGSSNLYVAGYFGSAGSEFNPNGSSKKATFVGGKDAFTAKYNTSACPVGDAITISGIKKHCIGAQTQYTTPLVTGATTYTWNITGDPQTIVSGQGTRTIVLEGTNSGSSSVEVTPGNGTCTGAKATLGITVAANPTFASVSPTNPLCGKNNGTISVAMTGGGSFSYLWSSGDNIAKADSLTSGTYYVTATNSSTTCAADTFVSLSDNGSPIIAASSKTIDLTCFKSNDGKVDLTLTGGTPPFNIFWSNGDTTEDVTGLQAGGYRVEIADSNGCGTSKVFVVTEPNKLNLNVAVTNVSTCALSDGIAEVTATGGTSGYAYAWSNSGNTKKISSLRVAAYFVTVTDSKGCKDSTWADVSDNNGPTLITDSMRMVNCGKSDGAIYITGTFSLTLTYKWSDNSSNKNLTGAAAGIYTVTATGGSCKAVMTKKLNIAPPKVNELCLITVDDSSRRNLIAFEKVQRLGLKGYNVFRESWENDVFIQVGFISTDSVSWWIDPSADPLLKPWKYEIEVENNCGAKSARSAVHRTAHLVVKKSDTTESNLTWTNYQGFVYPKVYIDRYTDTSGWKTIDSVNFNVTSYKDANPPFDKSLSYAIGVNHPNGCFANRAASKNLNSSRSNRAAPPSVKFLGDTTITKPKDTTSVSEFNGNQKIISLFPNPSKGQVNLLFHQSGNYFIEVISLTGEKVFAEKKNGINNKETTELNLTSLQAGVYFVGIHAEELNSGAPVYKRLVIH